MIRRLRKLIDMGDTTVVISYTNEVIIPDLGKVASKLHEITNGILNLENAKKCGIIYNKIELRNILEYVEFRGATKICRNEFVKLTNTLSDMHLDIWQKMTIEYYFDNYEYKEIPYKLL